MNLSLATPVIHAWADVRSALQHHHIITALGWQDVATRYRRSRVGAFWLTINMLVMIAALGLVFGTLFRQPLAEFLPYLAIGFILWGFLSLLINEGCTGFTAVSDTILQVRMPLFTHVMRVLWRNLIILGHNLLILPLLFLLFLKPMTWLALLAIPGFLLLTLNAGWMMLILAVGCAHFRDLTQIAQNAMQVLFFVILSSGVLHSCLNGQARRARLQPLLPPHPYRACATAGAYRPVCFFLTTSKSMATRQWTTMSSTNSSCRSASVDFSRECV